ncbi:MAG: hypothetical protein AB202_03155 [Parcubacteria bacterium C7867-007]|nr:MAG: hypothetical protein AB202_03155 [Parcubacteria bacterium C7867-007]
MITLLYDEALEEVIDSLPRYVRDGSRDEKSHFARDFLDSALQRCTAHIEEGVTSDSSNLLVDTLLGAYVRYDTAVRIAQKLLQVSE